MILTQKKLIKVTQYENFDAFVLAKQVKYENESVKRVEWEENDDAAKGFIGLSVDMKYYSTVESSSSSYELLLNIKNLFDGQNIANKFKLKDEFHNSRQNKNEKLLNYLDRVNMINDQLIVLGDKPMNNYDICVKIITTLLPEYNPVKMSCLMLDEKELNINYLRQRFAMESNNIINYNNNNNNPNTKLNNNNNIEINNVLNGCFKCGMINHKANNCKSPQWKIDKYKIELHLGELRINSLFSDKNEHKVYLEQTRTP